MTHSNDRLSQALAVVGAILIWTPLLLPFALAARGLPFGRLANFDYLLPAELFPIALGGCSLVLWAALRVRHLRGVIGGAMAVAVAALIGSQALAVATGLASGAIAAESWPWFAVLAGLGLYVAALIATGAAGIWVARGAFKTGR